MKTIAVLVILVAGCGSAERRGVWIDPGIPAAQVLQGCAVWAPYGADCMQADDFYGAGTLVRIFDGECPTGGNEPIFLGDGNPGNDQIAIRYSCIRDDVTLVHLAAHEFGHVFGLDHVDDAGAVMFWYTSATAPALTDADRSEWARVHDNAGTGR